MTDLDSLMNRADDLFGEDAPVHYFSSSAMAQHSGGFDMEAYLNKYGIGYKIKGNGSKTIYALDHCVFDQSHVDNDAAFFKNDDGRLGFHCFHNSCSGKGWKDARMAISGDKSLREFMPGYDPNRSSSSRSDGGSIEVESLDFAKSVTDAPKWPSLMDKPAFRGLAGRFVELACNNNEADPALVLMTYLCRFSVEVGVGPTPHLYVGDSKHYARIFVVGVGASSKARKGTSSKPCNRLFKYECSPFDSTIVAPARMSHGPLSSGEGIIYNVRDEVQEYKVDRKGNGQTVVTDPGVIDKRLYIQDEEFGGVLSVAKREGNSLSSIIRRMWDDGNLEPLTKNNRIRATDAHIGITTHITMPELHRRLDDSDSFNGFANRFLWTCSKRPRIVPFPSPMPKTELKKLQIELVNILQKVKEIERMGMTREARGLWADVYPALSRDHHGLVGAVINRAEAQVIRLSMIFALQDAQGAIDARHIESALAVWQYCEDSARFIFAGRGVNPDANKLFTLIKEKRKADASAVYKHFQGHITKPALERAVNELTSQGRIDVAQEATGGRPKTVFKVVESTTDLNLDF